MATPEVPRAPKQIGMKRALAGLLLEFTASALSCSSMQTGMDRALISRLENGPIDNPAIATMTRYARALGKKGLVGLVEAGRE